MLLQDSKINETCSNEQGVTAWPGYIRHSCKTLIIGVHEMHSLMHPNLVLATIIFVGP